MNKLFVFAAAALLMMGCAGSSNKIKNAAHQAAEIENSSRQGQNIPKIEYNDYAESPQQSSASAHQTDTASAGAAAQHEQAISTFDTDSSESAAVSQPSQTDKVIYLTFDDGPSNNTPKVLDILKQENVKATFFVTGHHENYVHLIKREFDEGHAIGAHTFSHKYSIYTSQETYFNDLEKLQKVIVKYTGSRTNLIRFPGGSSNTAYRSYTEAPDFMYRLCQEVRRRGYQYFDWNLSSKDSSKGFVPTSTIVAKACRGEASDICLLMHDSFGKETTVKALPAIIKYYKEKGYRFGTLDTNSSGYHHIRVSKPKTRRR